MNLELILSISYEVWGLYSVHTSSLRSEWRTFKVGQLWIEVASQSTVECKQDDCRLIINVKLEPEKNVSFQICTNWHPPGETCWLLCSWKCRWKFGSYPREYVFLENARPYGSIFIQFFSLCLTSHYVLAFFTIRSFSYFAFSKSQVFIKKKNTCSIAIGLAFNNLGVVAFHCVLYKPHSMATPGPGVERRKEPCM